MDSNNEFVYNAQIIRVFDTTPYGLTTDSLLRSLQDRHPDELWDLNLLLKVLRKGVRQGRYIHVYENGEVPVGYSLNRDMVRSNYPVNRHYQHLSTGIRPR